jgi:hypothetical protein
MKQLHVTIGTAVIQFTNVEAAGPIIAGLATARVCERDWNGNLTEKTEWNPTFAFVDPDTTAENPAVAAANKEAEQFRNWWSNANTENNKLKAEVKAMQEKLDAALDMIKAVNPVADFPTGMREAGTEGQPA